MPLINKVPSSSATEETSTVTANAADVIAGKKFIDAAGEEIIGTMQNNGQVNDEITENVTTYSHDSTAYALRNVISRWYNAFRTFAFHL